MKDTVKCSPSVVTYIIELDVQFNTHTQYVTVTRKLEELHSCCFPYPGTHLDMGNQNYHSAAELQTWEKLELIFFAGLTHSLTGCHMTGHMHFLIGHMVGHMHSLMGYMFGHIQSITGHTISYMLVSHLPSLVHVPHTLLQLVTVIHMLVTCNILGTNRHTWCWVLQHTPPRHS